MSTIDLYEILGVQHNASYNTIKSAYRELVLEHHPDRGGKPEFFEIITEAYNTLKNPETRKEYDNMYKTSQESTTDFKSLKANATKYYETTNKQIGKNTTYSLEQAKLDYKNKWLEYNKKHGFELTEQNSGEIDIEEARKKVDDLYQLREQENIEYVPEQIFTDPKNIDMSKFNAAFDALYKTNTNGDIIERKKPNPWNATGDYAGLETELYTENDDCDGQPDCATYSKTPPLKKITSKDIQELKSANYYTQHSVIDKNFDKVLKERLAEREKFTKKINNRELNDYSTEVEYGIFNELGINFTAIEMDQDDDIKQTYQEYLEYQKEQKTK